MMTIKTNRRTWTRSEEPGPRGTILTVLTGTAPGQATIKYGRDALGNHYKRNKSGDNWTRLGGGRDDLRRHDDNARRLFSAFATLADHGGATMETTVVVLDATTGARVVDPELRYGEDWRTSDDLLILEGTAYDLIRLANVMEKRARTPGYQSNTTLRMARELRDAADALLPYPEAPSP